MLRGPVCGSRVKLMVGFWSGVAAMRPARGALVGATEGHGAAAHDGEAALARLRRIGARGGVLPPSVLGPSFGASAVRPASLPRSRSPPSAHRAARGAAHHEHAAGRYGHGGGLRCDGVSDLRPGAPPAAVPYKRADRSRHRADRRAGSRPAPVEGGADAAPVVAGRQEEGGDHAEQRQRPEGIGITLRKTRRGRPARSRRAAPTAAGDVRPPQGGAHGIIGRVARASPSAVAGRWGRPLATSRRASASARVGRRMRASGTRAARPRSAKRMRPMIRPSGGRSDPEAGPGGDEKQRHGDRDQHERRPGPLPEHHMAGADQKPAPARGRPEPQRFAGSFRPVSPSHSLPHPGPLKDGEFSTGRREASAGAAEAGHKAVSATPEKGTRPKASGRTVEVRAAGGQLQ